ncbi:unnamed protein product [Camellia sinensis]
MRFRWNSYILWSFTWCFSTVGYPGHSALDKRLLYDSIIMDEHFKGQRWNLLRIAIFNISYIRGLFPEKYFHDKSVPAFRDEDQEAYTNGCKVLQTN